jgi:hypothetical protein
MHEKNNYILVVDYNQQSVNRSNINNNLIDLDAPSTFVLANIIHPMYFSNHQSIISSMFNVIIVFCAIKFPTFLLRSNMDHNFYFYRTQSGTNGFFYLQIKLFKILLYKTIQI